MNLRRRAGRAGRGQSLVEFAIVIPVFALLAFGLLDFGRVVYAQNTIANAAREATRAGIAGASQSAAKYAQIRSVAQNMAPGLGLTDANVTGQGCADCFYPKGATPGGLVVVKVSSTIGLLTPIVAQVIGGSFTVQSTAESFIP